jgi:hypothetical protein
MRPVDLDTLPTRCREKLLRRNRIFEGFFRTEAPRLAEACHEMSRRFLTGGWLLAFGNGSAATDARHTPGQLARPAQKAKTGATKCRGHGPRLAGKCRPGPMDTRPRMGMPTPSPASFSRPELCRRERSTTARQAQMCALYYRMLTLSFVVY